MLTTHPQTAACKLSSNHPNLTIVRRGKSTKTEEALLRERPNNAVEAALWDAMEVRMVEAAAQLSSNMRDNEEEKFWHVNAQAKRYADPNMLAVAICEKWKGRTVKERVDEEMYKNIDKLACKNGCRFFPCAQIAARIRNAKPRASMKPGEQAWADPGAPPYQAMRMIKALEEQGEEALPRFVRVEAANLQTGDECC